MTLINSYNPLDPDSFPSPKILEDLVRKVKILNKLVEYLNSSDCSLEYTVGEENILEVLSLHFDEYKEMLFSVEKLKDDLRGL